MKSLFVITSITVTTFISVGCIHSLKNSNSRMAAASEVFEKPIVLAEGESVITIVGTNDIHGAFGSVSSGHDGHEDGDKGSDLQPSAGVGGFDWFGGYMKAIREANEKNYGKNGIVLLLDAGDAAQGTLLSNLSEGKLAADLMNLVHYTAAIPGNHAYDFGPIGDNRDQCAVDDKKCNPRGALENFASQVQFPILSINVKKKNLEAISYYKDYMTIPFQGRNIAIIGIENSGTPSTTYSENVKDFVFTDGAAETTKLVQELNDQNQADVFVGIIHSGDANGDGALARFLSCQQSKTDCLSSRSGDQPMLDAVVAGHTHQINSSVAGGSHYIQSGSSGRYFGIIQLVVKKDPITGHLNIVREKTRREAAIPILSQPSIFMDQTVEPDLKIRKLLDQELAKSRSIAETSIAVTTTPFSDTGKRLADSEIGNLIADMMKQASGPNVDAVVIGSGDIRTGFDLAKNPLRYNDLYEVLPKSLQLVRLQEIPVNLLIPNIQKSIQTCGRRGALQISGIKIYFKRNCENNQATQLDNDAKLIRVITDTGKVLYPSSPDQTVTVGTTDFMLTGGAGYSSFLPLLKDGVSPKIKTVGPLRDLIVQQMQTGPVLSNQNFLVGRYINCAESKKSTVDGCKN